MGNQVLKLRREDAVLVGIDLQGRLMPVVKGGDELEAAAVKLVKGCRILAFRHRDAAIYKRSGEDGSGPSRLRLPNRSERRSRCGIQTH